MFRADNNEIIKNASSSKAIEIVKNLFKSRKLNYFIKLSKSS